MPNASEERAGRKPRGGRERCRADILAIVQAAGRPLTCKEVVRALKAADTKHGTGIVAKALAELTKAAELVNLWDKRGYRLREWRRPDRTPSLFDA